MTKWSAGLDMDRQIAVAPQIQRLKMDDFFVPSCTTTCYWPYIREKPPSIDHEDSLVLCFKSWSYLIWFMSTQQGILPPPPGVEPNFINPQNQFHGCTPFVAFYLTINSLALVMRLYTRRFIIRASLAIDDCKCFYPYIDNMTKCW